MALAGFAFGAGAAGFGAVRSSSDAVVVLCTTAGLAARLMTGFGAGLRIDLPGRHLGASAGKAFAEGAAKTSARACDHRDVTRFDAVA